MGVRRGVVLLEAVIALAIVAIAMVALMDLATASASALRRVSDADRRVAAANAHLAVVSLWPASALNQRLGSRQEGPWTLTIQRPRAGLYYVALQDSSGAELSTTLFRSLDVR